MITAPGTLITAAPHHLPWLQWGSLAAIAAAAGPVFNVVTGAYKARRTARRLQEELSDAKILRLAEGNASFVPSSGREIQRVIIKREAFLNRLTGLAELGLRAKARVALIIGETGLGKSWLVDEFLDTPQMKQEGVFILKVLCSLNVNNIAAPYERLLDALGELVKREQDYPEVIAHFRTQAPSWYDNSVKSERMTDLQSSNPQTKITEITSFFAALAARGLAVLYVDDVQWLDEATSHLLPLLMDKLSSAHMLMLLTCRRTTADMPLSLRAFCTEAHRKRYIEEIEVLPFTQDELGLYLKRRQPELLHLPSADCNAYVQLIAELSGCNPLFVDSLLETEQNVRYLKSLSDGAGLLSMDVLKANLPDTMVAVITNRFQSLTRVQRTLLEQATFQGSLFDSGLLASALGIPLETVEEELRNLQSTFLVDWRGKHRLDDASPSDRFEFRHQQDIDYLRSTVRSGAEQKYARAMAQAQEKHNYASRKLSALRLATLFQLAGSSEKQAEYLVLAAEASIERGSFVDGVRLADEALDLLARVQQTDKVKQISVEGDLIAGLGLAFRITYSPETVQKRYESALRKAEAIHSQQLQFRALAGLWLNHLVNARLLEAYQLAAQMRHISLDTSAEGSNINQSEASWAIGVTAYFRGNLVEAREALEAGIATYDRTNHREYAVSYPLDPGVACRYLLGRCMWLMGYPDTGLEQTIDAIDLGRELKHNESLAFSWSSKAIVHHLRGEPNQVREVTREMDLDLGGQDALRQFTAWPIILSGWATSMLEDPQKGLSEVERGLEMYRQQGSSLVLPSFSSIWAECLLRAQLQGRALQVIAEALADSKRQDQRYADSQLLRLQGLAILQEADTFDTREEAMNVFVSAESVARSQGARGFQLRAATSILELARGPEVASARDALRLLLATFGEGQKTGDYRKAMTVLEEKGFTGVQG